MQLKHRALEAIKWVIISTMNFLLNIVNISL